MGVFSRHYWRRGEPFVWATAGALSLVSLMTVGFVLVILANGLGFFWPNPVVELELAGDRVMLGEIVETEEAGQGEPARFRLKQGNRDVYGQDFVWVDAHEVEGRAKPTDAAVLERREYGDFYGFFDRIDAPGLQAAGEATDWAGLQRARDAARDRFAELEAIQDRMVELSYETERLKHRVQRLRWEQDQGEAPADASARIADARAAIAANNEQFEALQSRYAHQEEELSGQRAVFRTVQGEAVEVPLMDIVRAYRPNRMGVTDKAAFYAGKVWEVLTEEPRESNTEGGLFPAIFGTVMMVLLMSLFAIPFGVIAAIYLKEYAKQGRFVRLVRISVNNLAGVPSIVYGVFGLGFFIYTVGSGIDQMFYPHLLPAPTFGTGGILWASVTLALLTVPVVIVSTEEALSAIPQEVREGSLALGATKFQTLVRILLPMSTPGILTGFILAMARAAGEVAPLMLTGAVKLAPQLPLDGQFPFLHLDRKFMHLGFHIYDLAFQSPNVEAVLPMVYVTTILLLGIVILLSIAAIVLRNHMRKRYSTSAF